jgi:hypothetical protein
MKTFASPEEAARGDLPEEYVRVVGVVARGDEAVVAQITNADGYPDAYEIDTAMCHRTSEGWVAGSSGNGNMPFIQTSDDRCTVVWWSEAEDGVSGVRIRLGEQEQTVAVEDGFFFAVFDDVPWREFRPAEPPSLDQGAWGYARVGSPRPERPDWLDQWFHEMPKVEEWLSPGDE